MEVAKPRDVVTAEVMAEIAGMTWRNLLTTHIEPDTKFPIQLRGAEGVAWEFRVTKVLAHMIRRAKERVADNEARGRRMMELTGFSVPDDAVGAMNVGDINKLIEANMKAQKAKVEQRLYVPAEQVRAFIVGYNTRARNTILGEPQRLDPVGILPLDIRQSLDDDMRNLAVALQEDITEFLEEWCAVTQSGGTA